MVKYLQMDGVDDYIRTPSITFDAIEVKALIPTTQTKSYYFIINPRNGSPNGQVGNASPNVGSDVSTLYVDGVSVSKSWASIPKSVSTAVKANYISAFTDDINIFSDNNGGNNLTGNVYYVKVWNGGTLVAHYDMSTGTVQDQSGNGKHATLTGGTWLDDAPASTPESQTFSTRQVIYQNDAVSFQMTQSFIETFVADSYTFPMKQAIYTSDSQSFATKQRITDSDTQSFLHNIRIYSADREDFMMVQVIDKGIPTFESVTFPFRTFIHNMLVIEHDITGERFMFPRHNVNKETYEGFIQFQVVPRGFHLSEDQSAVPIIYMHDGQTELVRWEANSKDPINTMEKWRY